MSKNREEKTLKNDLDDDATETLLEQLRIAVPRIRAIRIEDGTLHVDVPPYPTDQFQDSVRQRAIVAETGLSGTELATVNYLLTTDEKIKQATGAVELLLKTHAVPA